MSVVKETFLICDGHCGGNFGVDSRQLNAMQHRKNAKLNGWVYVANKDLCPNCRPKRNDGEFPKRHNRKKKSL
jgi:hypothetical protein